MRIQVKRTWEFFVLSWQLFYTFEIISKQIIKLYTHTLLSMESHQSLILKINCFSANKHIKIIKIEKNAFKVSVISHKSSQKQKQVT